MKHLRVIEDFSNLNEEASFPQSVAPFYDGAAKIKAIVSSDKLASMMGMQSPDVIEKDSNLVYMVKGKSPSSRGKVFKVTLKKISGSRYEVSLVEEIVAIP